MARRTAIGRPSAGDPADGGYALAALLVGLAVMGIVMSMALPVWSHATRRERELELIFRGEQYARAVELYQRVFAGAYPPDVDTLIEERFLRRRYRDPMVPDGEFRIVHQAEVAELLANPAAATEEGPGEAGREDPAAGRRGARPTFGFGTAQRTAGFGAARSTSGFGAAAMATPGRAGSPLAEELLGGFAGVVSRSADESIRIYNGRTKYNEWLFVLGAEGGPGGPAEAGVESTLQPGRVAATPGSVGAAPGRFGATQRFGAAPAPGGRRPR